MKTSTEDFLAPGQKLETKCGACAAVNVLVGDPTGKTLHTHIPSRGRA